MEKIEENKIGCYGGLMSRTKYSFILLMGFQQPILIFETMNFSQNLLLIYNFFFKKVFVFDVEVTEKLLNGICLVILLYKNVIPIVPLVSIQFLWKTDTSCTISIPNKQVGQGQCSCIPTK